MSDKPTTVQLFDAEFTSALFETREARKEHRRRYLFGPGETSEAGGPAFLSGYACSSCSDGKFYVFYVADCAFPPLFLVQARSFEDAYSEFLVSFEHMVKIESDDLVDYVEGAVPAVELWRAQWDGNWETAWERLPEEARAEWRREAVSRIDWETADVRCTYNDSGTPCDAESVTGFEVQLVTASNEPIGIGSRDATIGALRDALGAYYYNAGNRCYLTAERKAAIHQQAKEALANARY